MSIPLQYDKRYKINQNIYNEIKRLYKLWKRRKDISKTNFFKMLAKKYNISYHTVYYWLNDNYRKKKREKNAKIRKNLAQYEKYIKYSIKRRKELWNQVPYTYIEHLLISAKNEKRANRKTIYGKSISYWEEYLKKIKKGGVKINEVIE